MLYIMQNNGLLSKADKHFSICGAVAAQPLPSPGGKVGRRQAGRKGNGDMLRKVCSMDKNMIHPASQHLSTVHS